MLLLCNYYVTYRCNAYCNFCHFANHNSFKNSKFATIEDFKKNVSEIRKMGVKFIDLTGGEPLLNPNIVEMANFAHNLNLQVSLTSNGLLYPKYGKALKGNIDLLHFSLDSPDENEHNKIRGINCYSAVIKSLELARSLGEYPDILFTVTDETFHKLPRMYEIARNFNLVLLVNPVFSYFGNEGLSIEAINYINNFCTGKIDVYLNDSYLTLRKDGGNHIANPLCKAVSRVIVISPDNKILLPCYHLNNKEIEIDKSIKEIRNSKIVKEYRKMEGRFNFCEGCTINCYFEPSFALPFNKYSIQSIPSKIKYGYNKLLKQKLFRLK